MTRQYELVERILSYQPTANEALLNRAYVYAMKAHGNQKRASGAPYFSHPLEVAAILAEMRLDDATIATALLHDTIEDTTVTRAEIDTLFGAEIGTLVDGLTKIKKLDLVTKKAAQAENFRKLLLAISSDIRVLLVKFADRLHNMRTLKHMKPAKRKIIAEETMDIYAPLAGRMGMQWLRDELEDHAFRWLNPEAYTAVVERLKILREGNQGLIDEIRDELTTKLKQARVKGVAACHVPDADNAGNVSGDDAVAVRAESHAVDLAGSAAESTLFLAAAGVPDGDRVLQGRGQPLAVGTKTYGPNLTLVTAQELRLKLGIGHRPQSGGVIPTCSGQPLAVGAKGHSPDSIFMAAQGPGFGLGVGYGP